MFGLTPWELTGTRQLLEDSRTAASVVPDDRYGKVTITLGGAQ